jgi:hypothetical protein
MNSIVRHSVTYTRAERLLALICATLFLLAVAIMLAGCHSPMASPETPAEAKLDSAQMKQLSAAAAAVDAANVANQANPDGLPKTAVSGELEVADANLPPASAADGKTALNRVNEALAGDLEKAHAGWAAAIQQGNILSSKVSDLEKQVAVERATAIAAQRKATERLCVIAALTVGGALFVGAALSLAAGLYFGLKKLELGAAGLALCGAGAFFAATQVGTTRFDVLAMIVLAGGVGGLVYVVWSGFYDGATIKAKASGFDAVFCAVRQAAGEVEAGIEADAQKLWRYLSVELDKAHKALVADWDKLTALFSRKTDSPPAAKS